MVSNSKEEPRTAPQPDRWYNLTLGPSYNHSSNKFCTLRYEFKPASIDKSKPGKLQKTKENRVSVEFQNNQLGKPKVAFEGSTEDYKDNDAVLFFDGETFRLERLHRAVKQLRHVRQPGESAAAAQSLDVDPVLSPPVGRGAKPLPMPTITMFNPVPVEVERIDIGEPQTSGAKLSNKRVDQLFESPRRSPATIAASPEHKNDDAEENHDIDVDDLFGDYEDDNNNNNKNNEEEENKDNPETDNDEDMNVSRQNDSDEEIADVDDSGDEGKGQNAADELRAQLNAEAGTEKQRSSSSSSSSSSSGSESSGSGSGSGSSSSSSGSEAASDDDSVNSI